MDQPIFQSKDPYDSWADNDLKRELIRRNMLWGGKRSSRIKRLRQDDEDQGFVPYGPAIGIASITRIHPERVDRKQARKQLTAYLECPNCGLHFWAKHLQDHIQESKFPQ